jgi:ketosteroid isomerase-like protein
MRGDQVIEVVLDQFAAVNERDFPRVMAGYADDVVLVIEGWGPNPGLYVGRDEVGAWFGDWFSTFERDYRLDIQEASLLADGLVLLNARHTGTGRSSGVEVRVETAYLYRVADERVVRVQLFESREAAVEAASLPEWSEAQTD